MMPVVRISDGTMDRLKGLAVPFEDTPESVVVCLLDFFDTQSGAKGVKEAPKQRESSADEKQTRDRAARTQGLRRAKYRIPLMETVYELGGEATTDRVHDVMAKRMAPELQPGDHKKVSTGESRWWNDVKWLRDDFVKQGLFRKGSQRGVWQLTEAGVKEVEAARR